MKSIASILVFTFLLCSFSSENKLGKGIAFFDGSWIEALAESKQTGKPIFVDVYASWCGPCKQLKRTTFKNAEVGAYFNKNFINFALDAETVEGKKLAEKYAVTSYPTLLIVDSNGLLKTKTTGFKEPYILINFGRRIVP